MSLLTPTELEDQVETDLPNTALQQLIDAAERDIEGYVGPTAAYVVEYSPNLDTILRLPVKASAVVSVTEYLGAESEPEKTALETDDYELSDNGMDLRRLSDGTNPGAMWGWNVVVTITPTDDTARRKQCAVELCRLAIVHSGYEEEKTGDWSATMRGLRKERSEILSRLGGSPAA